MSQLLLVLGYITSEYQPLRFIYRRRGQISWNFANLHYFPWQKCFFYVQEHLMHCTEPGFTSHPTATIDLGQKRTFHHKYTKVKHSIYCAIEGGDVSKTSMGEGRGKSLIELRQPVTTLKTPKRQNTPQSIHNIVRAKCISSH